MDNDSFEALVRQIGLQSLLETHRDELTAAAEHVEDLRGALDGKINIKQQPWPAMEPRMWP